MLLLWGKVGVFLELVMFEMMAENGAVFTCGGADFFGFKSGLSFVSLRFCVLTLSRVGVIIIA